MTTPGGAGSTSGGSRQGVDVPEDSPGLPAATGAAGGGSTTDQGEHGGPATDAVADQEPRGLGAAEDASDSPDSTDPRG